MHDKPQATPTQEFRLPSARVLAIAGRDAVAFAQAQFMSDVAALGDGQWQWSGWLTAKGRLIALFALLRLDAQTLWLLLPDADPAALADALRRYVFRSKVVLSIPDIAAAGCFAPPAPAAGNRFARLDDARIALDMSGDAAVRTLILGSRAAAEDADALARWDMADLVHGLPRLPSTQAGQWTPQQLSLERLRAFSVSKGCYPGQEIVARTHFLGQAKRGLALLEGDAPLVAGSEVHQNGQAIGSCVASAGLLALAVLPYAHADGLQDAAGRPLRQRPLADGLAR
ncbi:MAG: YgfZ/GcvT domain-containing protein [Thermomonas haemolytica]